ncbi:ATP-binding cassette domain-containing protein [Pedobacter sp. NJ-S-72]
MSFVQGTTVNLVRSIMVVVLLILIFENTISAGQYFSFLFYSFFLFGPLQELGNVILSWREAEVSLGNFKKILSTPIDQKPLNPKVLNKIESLEFSGLSFRHLTGKTNALTEISFKANDGETIAFVGPSGSGKTTLVKLLVGLYQPEVGEVLYNGITSKREIDLIS